MTNTSKYFRSIYLKVILRLFGFLCLLTLLRLSITGTMIDTIKLYSFSLDLPTILDKVFSRLIGQGWKLWISLILDFYLCFWFYKFKRKLIFVFVYFFAQIVIANSSIIELIVDGQLFLLMFYFIPFFRYFSIFRM
jgi:hypothetical protein